MRKKLNAAGLMTIAVAGALIVSTPAYAEESIAPAGTAEVTVPAAAIAGSQLSLFAAAKTVASDHHRRRHRHRRHRRHHRRHHYRHHRHHRYHHHRYHYWY